jgi:LPS-assembly protein
MRLAKTLTSTLLMLMAVGLAATANAAWHCLPVNGGWDCQSQPAQTTVSSPQPNAAAPPVTLPALPTQTQTDSAAAAQPPAAPDASTPTAVNAAAVGSAPATTPDNAHGQIQASALDKLHAGLDWAYCGAPPPGTTYTLDSAPDNAAPIEIGADAVELFRNENRALLQGDVTIDRGNQHLAATEARYDRNTNIAEARGDALLTQPGLRILGEEMTWNVLSRQGNVKRAHYRLEGTNARGTADSADIQSPTLSHYQNITYTSCPPNSQAWEIQANSLELDRVEGVGTARHAKLRVAGVPVLYTPYLSFPLDNRRKSGFLIPALGNSNKLGANLSAPYYLNLAPNMDATLIPRYMSKRGLMLGGEFRYLTRQDSGELLAEIIPDDRRFNADGVRGGLSFHQRGRFNRRWFTEVTFNLVSDDAYLEDFGRELRVTSTRNLERRADLLYAGKDWSLLSRLQGYQTLDTSISPTDRPYQRLPQILFLLDKPRLWQGLGLRLEAENVYFNHADKVHGNRLALRPVASLPLRRSYGHLIPKLSINHASYWLADSAAGNPDNPSITLPSASLDGGLVFVRDIHWLENPATQTLEPRLFYLYTPFEDQGDVPIFDSAELDFSFSSLFRENRFAGRDRIADANQLTLALTSRTLASDNGRELLRASIGQILYFSDRRVQLAGGTDEESTSAFASELAARFSDHWQARASLMWDPHLDQERTRKSSFGLHYRTPGQQLFNLTYRLNRGTLVDTDYEDTDMSFRWPVSRQLEFVGRWLYSMRYEKTMEAVGGLQYGQCCWRVRALVRNFVNSPEDESELSFMLQLELSSLGAFGSDVDDFLEHSVYGYEVN